MHQFQHGITRPFLWTVWARLAPCLGLDLLIKEDKNDAENSALLPAIKGLIDQANGDLPPKQSGEQNGVSPPMREDEAKNKDLQPIIKGQDDEGSFLPPVRGDEEMETENNDLQPQSGGQLHEKRNEDKDGDDGGKFQPAHNNDDGALRPTIGDLSNGEFFPHFVDYLPIDEMHDGKKLLFTYMHATIGGLDMASKVQHVITFAKPRVDPKVKKKTSLLLCLTIHTPFHPGEYGHDESPPYPHHVPYSTLCFYIKSLHPPPRSFTKESSSSAFSFLESLSNEDKAPIHEVLQPSILSIHLPFTPLRGRKGYQAHERQFQVKMMARSGSKTKLRTMMQMRLSYITKDMLDPG